MRTRVDHFVPGLKERFFIGTFHSFCADILRRHGSHMGINPDFNVYSRQDDLKSLFMEAIEERGKTYGTSDDWIKNALTTIQRLKSFLIEPEKAEQFFENKMIGARMAELYSRYESQLQKRNALDFSSLILKTYQLFRKYPAFAKRYRSVYRYVCIDEFQDTNQAQYELIRSLAGEAYDNIFAVADDDQIIYRWNGASHKRIKEFIDDFHSHVLQLPLNYRCPPEIVALANNLIRHNFFRTENKKPLEACKPRGGADTVRLFRDSENLEEEAAAVACDIKRLQVHEFGSVAVLGRNRKLLEGFDAVFKKKGLPAVVMQRKDEFESSPMVWLHSVLRLANDLRNQSFLEELCGSFSQLTRIDLDPQEVIFRAQENRLGYLQNWAMLVAERASDDSVTEIVERTRKLMVVGRDFADFSKYAFEWFGKLQADKEKDTDPSVETIAGYQEEYEVWRQLSREIADKLGYEIPLETFLQELQLHSKESTPRKDAITLLTIHGAKGKEFDHVYLVGLVEDELPSFQSKRKGDDSPEMEEERRNCFVAITRAMKTVTLSYAASYRGWPKTPSRFLCEMGL